MMCGHWNCAEESQLPIVITIHRGGRVMVDEQRRFCSIDHAIKSLEHDRERMPVRIGACNCPECVVAEVSA
jgi:hypothetical protein